MVTAPRLLCATLCGAALLLASCSSRPPLRDAGSPITFKRFDDADTNHDGKIDRDEVQALPELARFFDRIDTDHSGLLSWSEVRAARFPTFREPRYLEEGNDRN